MPLTPKGEKILAEMIEKYGKEEGERIFYASVNKGIITGVEPKKQGHEGLRRKATHKETRNR